MKLATFLVPGTADPHAGEVRGDEVVAFSSGTVLDRLAGGDRTPADGPSHALADVTLLAPIPRPPAIFCIGRNYAAHIAELGSEKPEKPLVFLKLPLSSAPPSGDGEAFKPPKYLQPGDTVRCEVEGLGVIEHPIA
jgi:2-keto-4-pentenoate hydratase/2-oxohepta-3-ene-1,7-dioic acid hydratase in catechol pathway